MLEMFSGEHREPRNKQGSKGYRHLLHKLILRVIRFGEIFDVILKPLNLTLHGGQTALQDLCRHCRKSEKKI